MHLDFLSMSKKISFRSAYWVTSVLVFAFWGLLAFQGPSMLLEGRVTCWGPNFYCDTNPVRHQPPKWWGPFSQNRHRLIPVETEIYEDSLQMQQEQAQMLMQEEMKNEELSRVEFFEPELEEGVTLVTCVQEGDFQVVYPDAPECCDGLSLYDHIAHGDMRVGASMCYDAMKGDPVCDQIGTENQGYYYPDGSLLTLDGMCG